MIYNVNNPDAFFQDIKFRKYCFMQMSRDNLKILPEVVANYWILLYLYVTAKKNSSFIKAYLFVAGCSYNLLKKIEKLDIVYGIRELFIEANKKFELYLSENEINADDFIFDMNMDINFFSEIDNKYIELNQSLNLNYEINKYYYDNMIDLQFEVNYKSGASTPGNLSLSKEKCKYMQSLYKEVCHKGYFKKTLKSSNSHLHNGDVQPAIVVSINPLRIFSYCDEFDGGIMLKFPNELAQKYNLSVDQKIVTINQYYYRGMFGIEPDILLGEYHSEQFRDVIPLVPIFLSDEEEKINNHILNIEDDMWNIVIQASKDYINKFDDYSREGMFYFIREK